MVNTFWPEPNSPQLQTHFLLRTYLYFDENFNKCVPNGPVNDKPSSVQVMAWYQIGDKHLNQWWPGPWFNIKMTSHQYRKSHCGDKTILQRSYLHNGISYTCILVRCHLYIESSPRSIYGYMCHQGIIPSIERCIFIQHCDFKSS